MVLLFTSHIWSCEIVKNSTEDLNISHLWDERILKISWNWNSEICTLRYHQKDCYDMQEGTSGSHNLFSLKSYKMGHERYFKKNFSLLVTLKFEVAICTIITKSLKKNLVIKIWHQILTYKWAKMNQLSSYLNYDIIFIHMYVK